MSTDNPFAPLPTGSGLFDQNTSELRVVEGRVYSPVVATWPARCVVCNCAVPEADFNLKMVWYPRYVILVFIFIRLIGIILYFVKRRTVSLNIGLCEEHRSQRRMYQWIGGGSIVAGFAMLLLWISLGKSVLIIFGLVALLGGAITLGLGTRLMSVVNVEGDTAELKIKGEFYESIR